MGRDVWQMLSDGFRLASLLFIIGSLNPKATRVSLRVCIFILLMTLNVKHAAYSQTSTQHCGAVHLRILSSVAELWSWFQVTSQNWFSSGSLFKSNSKACEFIHNSSFFLLFFITLFSNICLRLCWCGEEKVSGSWSSRDDSLWSFSLHTICLSLCLCISYWICIRLHHSS